MIKTTIATTTTVATTIATRTVVVKPDSPANSVYSVKPSVDHLVTGLCYLSWSIMMNRKNRMGHIGCGLVRNVTQQTDDPINNWQEKYVFSSQRRKGISDFQCIMSMLDAVLGVSREKIPLDNDRLFRGLAFTLFRHRLQWYWQPNSQWRNNIHKTSPTKTNPKTHTCTVVLDMKKTHKT